MFAPAPCLVCGRLGCTRHRRNGSTRRWRTQRAQILGRSGGLCEHCGRPAVDVHHLDPVAVTGRIDNEHPARLVALCESCHTAAHGALR